MATATAVKSVTEVTVTMTAEEARTIAILASVAFGDTYYSPRKHAASVLKALNNAGIKSYGHDEDSALSATKAHGVWFKNYST